MTYTENYNLKKPDSTDFVNIEDLNDNADTIDAALKTAGDSASAAAAAITAEATRAKAAEQANATAISTEATRAKAAEGELTTNLETALSNLCANNAGAHNAIYRGKSLGSSVTAAQYAAISAGTFEDLYIGDYWTINSVNWRIAGFDYWYNHGDTSCTTHHVVIVPDSNLYTAQMNTSNVTTGGYVGSAMYKTNLATAKTTINNAFGSAHILTHREYLTNAITSGYASAGSWYDSTVELMNEAMVYGSAFFTPHNSLGATIPNTYTIGTSQLPLFALEHRRICIRAAWWLRDVVSAAYFACVNTYGGANCDGASVSFGVRPAFGIKA